MLAAIFQLSAAFLFGYQIAFRNKEGIKNSTSSNVIINGKNVPIKEKGDSHYETYIYRIGFLYLIIGYLLPLTEIKIGENLVSSAKIFLVILVAIILVIVGNEISKLITKFQIDKD